MEQSLDLGGSISVSPSYTFYYSRETGLNYIRNVHISRIYGGFTAGRRSNSYIIIENNKVGRIKFKGTVNYLQMRMAYDQFCPKILIGEKGKEMGLEQLRHYYHIRRRVLHIIIVTILGWSFVCFICRYLDTRLRLMIMPLALIAVLLISIRALRIMMKAKEV